MAGNRLEELSELEIELRETRELLEEIDEAEEEMVGVIDERAESINSFAPDTVDDQWKPLESALVTLREIKKIAVRSHYLVLKIEEEVGEDVNGVLNLERKTESGQPVTDGGWSVEDSIAGLREDIKKLALFLENAQEEIENDIEDFNQDLVRASEMILEDSGGRREEDSQRLRELRLDPDRFRERIEEGRRELGRYLNQLPRVEPETA